MGKQIFNIKGMARDLDPAKTPNQYAYEIRNLRLTAQEDTTMLALVSEKGNAQYNIVNEESNPVTIQGNIVGYCILHNYLVLFTHDNEALSSPDYIYRLKMDGLDMIAVQIYNGDLGFGEEGINIEAIGIYENENLQKVYWIDNVHQPRCINIVADADTMSSWGSIEGPFDFVQKLNLKETVEVEKTDYNGMFNAGTIQYVLSYYNKNGQQTASFYQSPINYIAPYNRGASPEETVNNAFRIRVHNPDTTFDYMRIYSIFRSSENGTPVCKKVYDLETDSYVTETATYNGRPFVKFTNIQLGTYTEVNFVAGISFGVLNVYVIKNSDGCEVELENFFQYNDGIQSIYFINSDYSLYLVNNHVTPARISRVQAADGEYINLWKTENLAGANMGGTSQLKQWDFGDVTANIIDDDTRTDAYLEYIDNGLSQEVVSYSEILFLGGANIIPKAMAQKDQTLFFGNYNKASIITEENKDIIKNGCNIYFGYSEVPVEKGTSGSFYMYDNQLDGDAKKITTFKGGETYHFGIILQDSYGSWTDVVPVGPNAGVRNMLYPKDETTKFFPVKAYMTFSDQAKSIIDAYKAVKVVRLNTLPSVLYQGALCPTVFNKSRENNSPYSMSSWFFRPISPDNANAIVSHLPQNKHNGNIREGLGATPDPITEISEIQGAASRIIGYYDNDEDPSTFADNDMFVDWNTLTLHSPDIEFGPELNLNYKMRLVGILPVTASSTSMTLTWDNAPVSSSVSDHFDYTPIRRNNLSEYGYEIDLNTFAYKDGSTGTHTGACYYPVYPWHRNGSLAGELRPTGDNEWHALLATKTMASLREAASVKYLAGPIYDITKMKIYQDDSNLLLLEEDLDSFYYSGAKVYAGSMDVALMPNSSGYNLYGKTANSSEAIMVMHTGAKDAVRMKYKSTKHGVFSLKTHDNVFSILPNVPIQGTATLDLNSQYSNLRVTAIIKGVLSPTTMTYNAADSSWTLSGNIDSSLYIVDDVILIDDASHTKVYYIVNILDESSIKVKPIDADWLDRHPHGDTDHYSSSSFVDNDGTHDFTASYDIYFKYHDDNQGTIYYSVTVTHSIGEHWEEGPAGQYKESYDEYTFSPPSEVGIVPDADSEQIVQTEYDLTDVNTDYAYVYLAELYTDALNYDNKNTSWIVASESQKTGGYSIEASIGDTYFQRYDCLKTYPYTLEDQNQIVEIFSFMCETRINIDGRYDSRRGMIDNTTTTNTNFNLLNKAYTQSDNFYTYQYLDPEDFIISHFPNQLIWTGTKVYGSDVDAWTQIIPTSTLDLDGSLGEIRALKLWNDNLICFQDMGIAKIMYNERTTMSTLQGVPVEIANSGKVDGKQYISNQIGCSNKNSIQITQDGIYFIDSNTREIYRWAKGLESLSKSKAFNAYMQREGLYLYDEKTFYDPKLKDVYFRFNKRGGTECLVFNEQLGEFTSFFDYDMDFLFPFKDALIAVEHESNRLWKQFAGTEYLRYFGKNDGATPTPNPVYEKYSVELISAEHPTEDKIFNNVEFRADVLSNSIAYAGSQAYMTNVPYASFNKVPFTEMEVWNEYQTTNPVPLETMLRRNTNLIQKFRIWRATIGRDYLDKVHKYNRIRSPWARIKLTGGGDDMKTVIHDIAVIYAS